MTMVAVNTAKVTVRIIATPFLPAPVGQLAATSLAAATNIVMSTAKSLLSFRTILSPPGFARSFEGLKRYAPPSWNANRQSPADMAMASTVAASAPRVLFAQV
jgi:hypothetical protein